MAAQEPDTRPTSVHGLAGPRTIARPLAARPNVRDVCLQCNHNAKRSLVILPYPCIECGESIYEQSDLLSFVGAMGSLRQKAFARIAPPAGLTEKVKISVDVDCFPLATANTIMQSSLLGLRMSSAAIDQGDPDSQAYPFKWKHSTSRKADKHSWNLHLWDQCARLFRFHDIPQPSTGRKQAICISLTLSHISLLFKLTNYVVVLVFFRQWL